MLCAAAHRFISLGVALAFLHSLQGCTLDLVDPDLFAARFFTTLVLRPDVDGDLFFLDAKLEPGIGREGRRSVPDPTLEIDSSPHYPSVISDGDPPAEFGWRIETGLSSSPLRRIRIRTPTVNGLGVPSDLELPAGIALLPQGTIQLVAAEDLVLHLEPPADAPSFLRWSLSLTNLQAGPPFLLYIEGVGIWPEEIRVLASQLPQVNAFVLRATVRVIAEFEPTPATEGYEILGRVDFVMERSVVRGDVLTVPVPLPSH
jgi:hypothetical protein